MPRGVSKTRCSNTWSESKYWCYIRSGLRRLWLRYPVRSQALQAARRPYKGEDKRTKWEYKCASCKKWHKTKDVEVDHIEPAGSLLKYEDLAGFCKRLFCEIDNLQVVCKTCHKEKTNNDKNL